MKLNNGLTGIKMKKNNIVFVVFVLFALIFLYGCIEKSVETGPVIKKNETHNQTGQDVNASNQTNQTLPTRCEDLLIGKERCIIERAYNNMNIDDCELLLSTSPESKSYYVECVSKLSSYNYSYCSKLDSLDADMCYKNASSKFGDSACNMINNLSIRRDCLLRDYAEECKQINDTYKLNICNSVAKRNSSYCEKMPSQLQKDECYMNYSITLSENKCPQISSVGIKTACESILAKNVQCGGLENVQVKDYCYQYYAMYSSSCSWCGVIQTATYKDDCYQKCTAKVGEMNFCREISTEQKRDSCYWDYAMTNLDVAACNEIKTIMLKKTCVQNVAKLNAMPSECEILLNTTSLTRKDVSDCYIQVIAGSQVSFENCIKMNDGYYKDLCINMAIKRERLATDYCAYILDEALKNECMKQ
ncbi:MAG: hypothetical protein N3G74_00165 [Candidatus Micrarchaeota archaeon]|nr:hypothetical protein [Candidatus Micrarchaeota archaeon]